MESAQQPNLSPNYDNLNSDEIEIPIAHDAGVQQSNNLDESSHSSVESVAPHTSNANRTPIVPNNTSRSSQIINPPDYHSPSRFAQYSLHMHNLLPSFHATSTSTSNSTSANNNNNSHDNQSNDSNASIAHLNSDSETEVITYQVCTSALSKSSNTFQKGDLWHKNNEDLAISGHNLSLRANLFRHNLVKKHGCVPPVCKDSLQNIKHHTWKYSIAEIKQARFEITNHICDYFMERIAKYKRDHMNQCLWTLLERMN